MRSIEEHRSEIIRRSAEIARRKSRQRAALCAAASTACSFALILVVALTMPDFENVLTVMPTVYGASFAASSAVGYVVIGVLAFALGACTALLCMFERDRSRRKR